jgi:hypothetical protein
MPSGFSRIVLNCGGGNGTHGCERGQAAEGKPLNTVPTLRLDHWLPAVSPAGKTRGQGGVQRVVVAKALFSGTERS